MISLSDVSIHFKRRGRPLIKALDNVTLTVPQGEFFALLGENGAGKSTTMHCMLGLIRPTRGSVLLFGREPRLGSDVYQDVGYLPEEPHHYPSYLTVAEAIEYYARLYRRVLSKERRDGLLERLGLGPYRDLRIGKCSKGMKQKVGIAQCLIGEPRLLFLDEPMRGLDPLGVRDFRDILVELNRGGCTIVMNSHILAEVESVATSVAILKRGTLIVHDRLANLAGDRERFDVTFEGDPPDYIVPIEQTGGRVRGTLPPERAPEFLSLAAAGAIRLTSFQRSHASLEETFLTLVSGEPSHA